jgi:Glycoside hydrolase family 44
MLACREMRVALVLTLPAVLVACGDGGSPSAPTSPVPSTNSPAGNASVRFTVDTGTSRQPISPYIYGSNHADFGGRQRSLRLGRLGGNRWTAYNWETNASNAGADFRHQNDGFLGGGDTPGEAVRPWVERAHAAAASVIVTVPIAGYASADKRADGDVAQTPDYLNVRFETTALKGGHFAFPPDIGDGVVYLDEFVAWLESTFPHARTDGSRALFYSLDNEPDLWFSTHPRIRPTGRVTYAEIVERTVAASTAIKRVAPSALVFGPVSYGWQGFVSLQDAPDARGRDFLDFYLSEMQAAEAARGRRLLDVLDLHWYPEARGGGTRITERSNSTEVANARMQAPRSLWDPGYVETSWISQDAGVGAIRLLPRMREKIGARYPGTRLAVTEWFFGGGDHISGAVAHADVLGIFGREVVFAAALWKLYEDTPYVDAAFQAFCDFDGRGSRFADTSVTATTTDYALTSVYASVDAASPDNRVVLVALNKSAGPVTADLSLTHAVNLSRGRSFRITASSPSLGAGPDLVASARNAFRLDLPSTSVTVVELLP